MGRKSKPPVKIDSGGVRTEVPPQDGLPPFKRFIDIDGKERGQKILTRLFFVTPSDEEVTDTVQKQQSNEVRVFVTGATMPYMTSGNVGLPLLEHCNSLGFSEAFSVDIVRLAISYLQGKHLGGNSIRNATNGLREFVGFLATRTETPQTPTDIRKENWIDYLEFCVADDRVVSVTYFNTARRIFHSYAPTSIGGWLHGLKFKKGKRRKPSREHTSELAETRDYSDVVMYQLLCLFIYLFEQRIQYLKRYERLTEADMPQDWLYPGRKPVYLGCRGRRDTSQLLRSWLCDEDAGYQTIIDHYILHHKSGLIARNRHGAIKGGIASTLTELLSSASSSDRALAIRFFKEMGSRHGYEYPTDPVSLLRFYVKKNTATERNTVINQIGWCLANLLMIQTGINKEVALTIPSKAEDGKSILTRSDTVFVRKDGAADEINLYGIKARTGGAPEKIIPIIIARDSPLYEMLVEYELYVKVGHGPFFEFNRSFIDSWPIAGNVKPFSKRYPVTDEKGRQLTSIDSTRFRKVFASGQLLDRMKNIKDMNELAEKLREDLNHGDLDTTLTNYLLKSTIGRSVIDIAIATITGGKLNDLKCRSQIALRKPIRYKKRVFLCYCVDPHNPSHDVSIADECRHYDLCLGCEQSTITKDHLPYICLRLLQYEAEREKDPLIWAATFEDRWCIAHDALARYINADKKNGRGLVDDAWITARQGRISLPPIIAPTRM